MDILVIVEDNHGAMHRLSKEAIAGAQTINCNDFRSRGCPFRCGGATAADS